MFNQSQLVRHRGRGRRGFTCAESVPRAAWLRPMPELPSSPAPFSAGALSSPAPWPSCSGQQEERAARLKEEVERAALSGLGQLGHAQYPAPKLADTGVLAGYSGMHLNGAVGRCGVMAAADVSAYVKWALCLQEKLELMSVEYNSLLALLDRVQDDNKRLHEENLYLRSAMAPPSLEQLQQAGGLDPMMQACVLRARSCPHVLRATRLRRARVCPVCRCTCPPSSCCCQR